MPPRFRLSTRAPALAALLVALVSCDGSPPADLASEVAARGPRLYSQFDEELLIRHFFGDRRGGVFVDVGAFHWKTYSTTLYLEERLGWSGIAIDALPHFAEGYALNRPNTRFFEFIVTDHSGGFETIYDEGAVSSTDPDHIELFAAITKRRPEEQRRKLEVPTITLDDLLEREGVTRIDFLSMDIEGGEPRALAGFDIERFRPELVCIEAGPNEAEQLLAYFEAHHYERIEAYLALDAHNWYFRPSSD